MTTVIELTTSGERERSWKSVETLVRQFQVSMPAEMVPVTGGVVDDISGLALPAINDEHPALPHLRCDNLKIARMELVRERSVVTAFYSNDRRWGAAPRDDEFEPNFRQYRSTFQEQEIQFPAVVTVNLEKKLADGSTETVAVREQVVQTVLESMMVVVVRVSAPALTPAEIRTIGRQHNRIHVIGGEQWRMEGGEVQQEGDSASIDYTWIRDEGTPNPPTFSGAGWQIPLSDATLTGLYRLPHHYLIHTQFDPAEPGVVENMSRYDFSDPDGWRGLPGTPIA